MPLLRRLSLALGLAVALVLVAVLGATALGGSGGHERSDRAGAADPRPGAAAERRSARPAAEPAPRSTPTATTAPTPPPPTATATATATPSPTPELVPGPALLSPGDDGAEVRELQARLAQIDWFDAGLTDHYGEITEAAVRGFQDKRAIPVTGEVDQRTMDRLLAMTTEPTDAELEGRTQQAGALDPRCLEGRVICVDKSTSTLRWVVDGEVLRTLDARFGAAGTPTREGLFEVYRMSRDHVSSLFDTAMPYAMFFSGGQAVHYSPDFAATGYAGASHGCVNTRDLAGVAALFEEVRLGDDVVVYWS